MKACSICGGRALGKTTRCARHPNRKARTRAYFTAAARVRATATICWICRRPFTDPNDPPVADHIIPRVFGGRDDETNLAPAHKSCNARRGQQLQQSRPRWLA